MNACDFCPSGLLKADALGDLQSTREMGFQGLVAQGVRRIGPDPAVQMGSPQIDQPLETLRVDSGCIGLVDQTGYRLGCRHNTLVGFRRMCAPVVSRHLTRRPRFIHDAVDLRLLAATGVVNCGKAPCEGRQRSCRGFGRRDSGLGRTALCQGAHRVMSPEANSDPLSGGPKGRVIHA